jgi:FAD/FMN-containing dehydrogenase
MKRRAFFRSGVAAAAALSLPRNDVFAAVFRPAPRRPQDIAAVTGDGKAVTLSGKAIADLRSRMRGRVLLAQDEGYDSARRILNPIIDKRPALIAQVTGVADIRAAVDFARDNGGLLTAVKCGGHSTSGQSTCDRGMMIDLSAFRNVRVDPTARRAWVTGGSLLGMVDHETAPYELVTTLGTVSHTGVGGLVTGGGFGRVGRRFGLAIDNLVSVDVVTADGQLVHASADENPDLFWGVRGGGGNFGIVTNFEFRLHPMQRQVVAGFIGFPMSKAADAWALFDEYGRSAPEELDFGVGMSKPPGDAPAGVGFAVCWSGPASGVDRALAPIRALGTPVQENIRTMDYVAVQRSGDITDPRAMGVYLKGGFVPGFPQELVRAIVERFEPNPGRVTSVFSQLGGGAIARVAPDATAFPARDVHANLLCTVGWPTGQDGAEHIAWIREYWSAIEPFTHGFYVNDLEVDASAAKIQANYRQNHARLVAVKNRYDPKNLFRLNANVKPTATTPAQ